MKSSYRDLKVWQRSFDLSFQIYKLTQSFPKEEMFGLTSQIRRAAVSISSNIAEGKGRGSDKEFCRFLLIAKGSCNEVENQLLLAAKLNYIKREDLVKTMKMIEEVLKMLSTFITKLS